MKEKKPSYEELERRCRRAEAALEAIRTSQAGEELQKANRFLNEVERIGKIAGWELDIETNRLTWSDELYRIREVDRSFVPTVEKALTFYTPSSRILMEKALRESREQGKSYDLELEMFTAKGKYKWVHTMGKAVKQDGRIVKLIGTFQDITEHKKVRAELENARKTAEVASRVKSEFITSMSHELRTPLNAIIGYGQILTRDETLAEHHRENVNAMKISGEHLLTLINDLLDMARIEAGKIELDDGPTDLRALISSVAAMMRSRAYRKQIGLIEKIDPAVPRYVQCDEKRLRQVLLNLLSNGIRFTEEGSVTLTARPADGRIAFQVTDTGIGIPADRQKDIFDPFHQIHEQDTSRQGTGLGLTISQNLVMLMGGTITVESTVGKGSTFRFEIAFPEVSGEGVAGKPGPVESITGYEGRRRIVLIVDDSVLNRKMICAMLGPLGFENEEAADGWKALEKAENLQPDVILMNLILPGIGGEEAIRTIRSRNPSGKKPVIIVITGKADPQTKKEALHAGADDFMIKPIQIEAFLAKLEHHLNLKWKYTPAAQQTDADDAVCSPPAPPPEEDISALHRLSRMGDLSGISDYVHQMCKSRPDTAGFCRIMKAYADNCDMKAIRYFIRQYTERENDKR